MTDKAGLLLLSCPLGELYERFPALRDLAAGIRMENLDRTLPLPDALEGVAEAYFEDFETSRAAFAEDMGALLDALLAESAAQPSAVESITILGGRDKSSKPEKLELTLRRGEVVGLVGPTGAGKSRLLEDIECLAQGDTPTGRHILLNGEVPGEELRFDMERRLVAQLTQNMNFVMDLTVREFLLEHAASRLLPQPEEAVRSVFACANDLAGEPFGEDVTVTQLSGGQSRALMIADVAVLSDSPIVLIDEIENAGIDRQKAVALLASREKIVLISTHDPLLALSADRRLVIRNGAVAAVIQRQPSEEGALRALEDWERRMHALREALRAGEIIATAMDCGY